MHLNCAQYVSCTHLHLDMSTWWLQIVYYDGQFDDSRLCLALACTAALAGAAVANHTEATKLLKVSLSQHPAAYAVSLHKGFAKWLQACPWLALSPAPSSELACRECMFPAWLWE